MTPNIKHSRQRDAIKEMLMSRYDHPTAEQLYNDLKADIPKLSLGTVYRNLSLLSELGEIKKVTTPCGSDRFDGRAYEHYHFYCEKCCKVEDVAIPLETQLNVAASSASDAEITSHSLVFYGICKNCKKNVDK